jgi:hybrid cluster-associated redox disulfide protein
VSFVHLPTATFASIGYDRIPTQREHAGRREAVIFTKNMSIMEALQADPRARQVFVAFGMGCAGCMGVSLESIADGAKMHGIDPEVVMAELNKLDAPKDTASE